MKKRLALAFGLLLLVVGTAFAGVDTLNLSPALRTHTQHLQYHAESTAGTSTGSGGLILYRSLASGNTTSVTSGFVPASYAARLLVDLIDAGTSDTLVCTVRIVGTNQFGQRVAENVSATETVATTVNAYETITSVTLTDSSGSGCSTASDNSDYLVLATSKWVALDRPIAKAADLIVLCQNNGVGTEANACKDGASFTVNIPSQTVDVTTASLGTADKDEVVIKYRSSITSR